jgi:thiamine biosynthesis lipoprotein
VATTADPSVDRHLRLMGTHIRILVGPRAHAGMPEPAAAADQVEAFLHSYEAALSRFRPDSELCALNADPRSEVPASDLLRSAVRAALEAARISGGLVDPTLLGALEDAGYVESWDRERRVDLRTALSESRAPRHPASPGGQDWASIHVDDEAETIRRPAGLRLDTGGSGKGHAADLAATLLFEGYEHWAVDCGGDLRIGGASGATRDVELEDPFTGAALPGFQARRGAVATSGLRSRLWREPDGEIRHHLLDPSTGRPAFTGLVAVTALAPTAVEAEARAKAALLSGPDGARTVLQQHGGIVFDEDGTCRRIGRLEPRPVVRLRMPAKGSS